MGIKVGDEINGFIFLEKLTKKGYWKVKHRCGNTFTFRAYQAKRQKYCKHSDYYTLDELKERYEGLYGFIIKFDYKRWFNDLMKE